MAGNDLLCVPPEAVADLWNAVRPMIERAYAETDEFCPTDMLDGLKAGKLLLWVSAPSGTILAVLVTALLPKPSGLACKLVACGGTGMKIWLNGHTQIEAYARAEGCAKLLAEARPGWIRKLPGYTINGMVLEKRLI